MSILVVFLFFLSICLLFGLNALDCEVLRGAQVQMQARARWAEEDEKKRATDCYISALRAGDGSFVMDKDGLSISISLLLFLVTLLSHISSVLPFNDSEACEGLLSQGDRGSILLLLRVCLAVMAFPWNFI